MKLFYAANKSLSSKIQLQRFLQYNQYDIKIAAYANSTNLADYTLDALDNFINKDSKSFNNENYIILYEAIKKYSPDLIISDLEPYSSSIGVELNIPVWQCSSLNFVYSFNRAFRRKTKVHSKYKILIENLNIYNQNIINNSNQNFIYSHFGDTEVYDKILDNFKWARPYFDIGKYSPNCKHNILAICPDNNKTIISNLKKHDDVVVFSELYFEDYKGLKLKDINNEQEYYCNLFNCNKVFTDGNTNYFADAYYNNKPITIFPDYSSVECLFNESIFNWLEISSDAKNVKSVRYNSNVKFLHEYIEDYKKGKL